MASRFSAPKVASKRALLSNAPMKGSTADKSMGARREPGKTDPPRLAPGCCSVPCQQHTHNTYNYSWHSSGSCPANPVRAPVRPSQVAASSPDEGVTVKQPPRGLGRPESSGTSSSCPGGGRTRRSERWGCRAIAAAKLGIRTDRRFAGAHTASSA